MNQAAERLALGGGSASVTQNAAPTIEYWTCTMHPDVRQDEAGDCPICGMELVAKYDGVSEPGVKPTASKPGGHSAHGVIQNGASSGAGVGPLAILGSIRAAEDLFWMSQSIESRQTFCFNCGIRRSQSNFTSRRGKCRDILCTSWSLSHHC